MSSTLPPNEEPRDDEASPESSQVPPQPPQPAVSGSAPLPPLPDQQPPVPGSSSQAVPPLPGQQAPLPDQQAPAQYQAPLPNQAQAAPAAASYPAQQAPLPGQQPYAQPFQPQQSAYQAQTAVAARTVNISNPAAAIKGALAAYGAGLAAALIMLLLALLAIYVVAGGDRVSTPTQNLSQDGSTVNTVLFLIGLPAQFVSLAFFGSAHVNFSASGGAGRYSSDFSAGAGTSVLPLLVLLATLVVAYRAGRKIERNNPREPIQSVIVGALFGSGIVALLSTLLTVVTAARFDGYTGGYRGVAVHAVLDAAGVLPFFAILFLLGGALVVGRLSLRGRPTWWPRVSELFDGFRLALGYVLGYGAVAVVFLLIGGVITALNNGGSVGDTFKALLGAILMLPLVVGQLLASVLGLGHLGSFGVSVTVDGSRVSGLPFPFPKTSMSQSANIFVAPWYVILIAILLTLAFIIGAAVVWARGRLSVPGDQLAGATSWLALPIAFLVVSGVLTILGTAGAGASVQGSTGGYGRAIDAQASGSAGPAAWTPLVFALVGLLIEVLSRYAAPFIPLAVPVSLIQRIRPGYFAGNGAAGAVGALAGAPAAFAGATGATNAGAFAGAAGAAALAGAAGAAAFGGAAGSVPPAPSADAQAPAPDQPPSFAPTGAQDTAVIPAVTPAAQTGAQTEPYGQTSSYGQTAPYPQAAAAPAPLPYTQTAPYAQGAPLPGLAPHKPMDPKKKKRIVATLVTILVVAVLIVAALITISVLKSTKFSPKGEVEKYLTAVQDGRFGDAAKMAPPSGKDNSTVLLTNEMGEATKDRIESYSIEKVEQDGDSATVHVKVTVGGKQYPESFLLHRNGTTALIFPTWAMGSQPYSNMVLPHAGKFPLTVNGIKVNPPAPDTASSDGTDNSDNGNSDSSDGGVLVPVLPGTYHFGVPVDSKDVTVTTDTITAVPGEDVQDIPKMEIVVTQEGVDKVNAAIKKHVDDCFWGELSNSVKKAGCEDMQVSAYTPDGASGPWRIQSYPKVDINDLDKLNDSGDFTASETGEATYDYTYTDTFFDETNTEHGSTSSSIQSSGSITINGKGEITVQFHKPNGGW